MSSRARTSAPDRPSIASRWKASQVCGWTRAHPGHRLVQQVASKFFVKLLHQLVAGLDKVLGSVRCVWGERPFTRTWKDLFVLTWQVRSGGYYGPGREA
jgi:hypothetical protein